MDWEYDTSIDLNEYEGFVYLIENTINGRLYIGKKTLWSRRTKVPKGKVRRVKTTTESNWRDYYGSSKTLAADIETYGREHFKRIILHFHKTKGDLSYAEAEEQVRRDVLRVKDENGNRIYYNDMIKITAYARR